MKRLRFYCLFLALTGTSYPAVAAPVPGLARIVANEKAYAREFANNAAICVQRHDTDNPAFHGCIDWHSATHGVWALVAYGNLTGDRRFDPLIASILTPAALSAEQRTLAGKPSFEMPYGRAWLLRLAIEYETRYHSNALRPIADTAARSLDTYLRSAPEHLEGSYSNTAWGGYNLLRYYRLTGQRERADSFRRFAASNLTKKPSGCAWESAQDDFLSNCSTMLLEASEALPRHEARAWLKRMDVPANLQPIDPHTSHGFGLNYSRSWGLWQAYAMTGDPKYERLYARHFLTAFGRQADVRKDYGQLGHWVSQFGMLAVQPLFSRSVAKPNGTASPQTAH